MPLVIFFNKKGSKGEIGFTGFSGPPVSESLHILELLVLNIITSNWS